MFRRFLVKVRTSQRLSKSYLRLVLARRNLLLRLWERLEASIRAECEPSIRRAWVGETHRRPKPLPTQVCSSQLTAWL